MSFITPLISSDAGHETSPREQSDMLTLVQDRLKTLTMLAEKTNTAVTVQTSQPQSSSEHFMNNNPMAKAASIVRASNALGELAGLEQTHSHAAAVAVGDFSNGDLNLQQALSSETHAKYIDEITSKSFDQSQTTPISAQITANDSYFMTEADQAVADARARVAQLQSITASYPAQHIIDATNHSSEDQFSLAA